MLDMLADKCVLSFSLNHVKVYQYILYSFQQVYRRLQRLMLCLSPSPTLQLIDSLGSGFDDRVLEWKSILLDRLEGDHYTGVVSSC